MGGQPVVEEGKLGFVGVFEITIVGTGVLDGPQKHIPENEHSSVGIGPSRTPVPTLGCHKSTDKPKFEKSPHPPQILRNPLQNPLKSVTISL